MPLIFAYMPGMATPPHTPSAHPAVARATPDAPGSLAAGLAGAERVVNVLLSPGIEAPGAPGRPGGKARERK